MTAPPCTAKGFALLIALVAIVIISALTSVLAYAVSETGRAARLVVLEQHALSSAEGAAWTTFAAANTRALRAAPIGLVSQTAYSFGALTQHVTVTKLDTTVIWIAADAHLSRGRDEAAHQVALMALLPRDSISSTLTLVPGAPWTDFYENP